jgi:hypothetical protein
MSSWDQANKSEIFNLKNRKESDNYNDNCLLIYFFLMFSFYFLPAPSTLRRHNTENSKQIFLEKELRCLSPNFHIHVSVIDLYSIPAIGQPILLQENMWINPRNK